MEQDVFNEVKKWGHIRGSYKLTFTEVCEEPHPSCGIASGATFKLFFTPDGFICTTRVKRVRVWNTTLHFPYLADIKPGKPRGYSDIHDYTTFRCTSVRSTLQYQKQYTKLTGEHLFLHGSERATPIGIAVRRICADMRQAENWKAIIIEAAFRPLKPRCAHLMFWTSRDREMWTRYGTGCCNESGAMWALKRDSGRFKYKKIISTEDFAKINMFVSTLPRYAYFNHTLSELGYGTF